MKKIFWCLTLLMVLLLPVAAMAEGELPTDPFTWAQLATIAGATLATVLVYFIALVILLLATAFTDGLTLQTGLLTAVNAVIVALAAMGAYEITFRKLENK